MTEFATLILRAEARGVIAGEKALDRLGKSADVADREVTQLSRGMRSLAGVAGTLAGVFSISAIAAASERYAGLTNSLKAMGLSAEDAEARLAAIADIAFATRAPLEATAQLYNRIAIAAGELGASQRDVLQFTENVGLALGSAGIGANEASGALMQLSQAMAGGTVRAEEFNSILENAFPLAQAAARGIDEAGGSIGRLRQLVVDGQISSEEFFNAILSQSNALAASFAATQITVGGALTQFGLRFTMLVGSLDQMTGASAAAAQGISFVADNLQLIASVGAAAVAVLVGAYVPAIVSATVATAGLVASLITLRGALLATGIGALVVGAGLMIDYLLRLRTATGSWGAALQALGDLAAGVWEGIKGSAQAIVPALNAVWADLAAGFYMILERMAAAWRDFLSGIAGGLPDLPGFNAISSRLQAAADRADVAFTGFMRSANDSMVAADGLREEARALASAGFEKARQAAERLNAIMNQTSEETTETADSARGLAEQLGGEAGVAGGAAKAAEAIEGVVPEVQSMADALRDQATTAIDGVAAAFGDFIAGGLRDFKGFAKSIIDSFKGMISQLIATAVGNPIKIALGLATTPGAAVANVAAPSGGGGLLSSISGAAGGFLGGVGSGLQAALGMGGFTSAGIFNVAANAATAAATGVSALSATIGAAIPVVAGIAAVFSFFRTKTKTLDGGIRVAIDGVEALTETFQVIERRRFWGLSRSIRETFGAADRELVDAVQDTYSSLRESVLDMGSVLGIGARALNGFVSEIKLSTKGMSAEDAQAAVLAEFEKLGVQMAEQIMGTRREIVVDARAVADAEAHLGRVRREATLTSNGFIDSMSQQRIAQAEAALAAARAGTEVTHLNRAFDALKKPGESALDLLTRLSSGFAAANHAMRALGHALFDTSAAGIRASAGLVEAMGGLEQFQRGVDFFFRNFYSAQEQAAFATRDFASSLRDLGLGNTPRTMEQFRAMVDRLMDAGRVGLAGQLINLAPAFVEMLRLRGELQGLGEDAEGAADRIDRAQRKADQREDLERRLLELQGNTAELRRRELAALFPANRALQRMIWGLEDAQSAMEALEEEDFATLFDFERARGRAAAGMRPYQALPVPQAQVAVTRDPDVQRELADLNNRLTQIMTTVAQTSRQTAQVLRKWDNIGLPAERVA